MTRYRQAGVDIDAGHELVRRIKPHVRSTYRPEVLTEIGGFGGLFRFASSQYEDPVLVSGTDGVGTKLKIACLMERHETIGIDLVAMCVNDVAVTGAEPLFFLDYLATGELSVETAESIIGGIAEGCRQAGCALIGGETAEMPASYPPGEYDLAGFAVGVVERGRLIDGAMIKPGDVLVGLQSSGLHSNGFSLVRRVLLEEAHLTVGTQLPELERSLGDELLTPTRIYVQSILALVREFPVRGIAHITGGGLTDNLPRILPEGCAASIDCRSWQVPSIFGVIQRLGRVDHEEMYRVFNMGIGLVLVMPRDRVDDAMARVEAHGDRACVIGEVVQAAGEAPTVTYRNG